MVKVRAGLPTMTLARAMLGLALLALALAFALVAAPGGAWAQSSGDKGQEGEQPAAAPMTPVDPAAPPAVDSLECSWIGQRILMLLWRDDIDTAKDFIEIYDRFGCPKGHEAPAFRCLVQIGVNPEEADPGLPERAKACWENPALDPNSFEPTPAEQAPAQQ
jgi:hypothetical protein